ncbi:MAG: OmpA family protein [Yokenella regensburgei]|jgi:outer membrane protein OmpA-like peptidoglycan-associated protein|nr:OmpA family protein [Yokenella regensburgei]
MSVRHQRLLWLWGGLLAVLLCLLFLPLTPGERGLSVLLVMAVTFAGLIFSGRRPDERYADEVSLHGLPDAPYRLPLVLVCGDTDDWPGENPVYRTAQGCWLRVPEAALQQTVRRLLWLHPERASQLAVMVCIHPQQHDDDTALTARLLTLRWQMVQVRRDTRQPVPLLLVGSVADGAVTTPVWQSVMADEGIQVWQDNGVPLSARTWLSQVMTPARLHTQILFSAHARFVSETLLPVLTGDNPDMPAVMPSMVLYHRTRNLKVHGERSLWQQFLTRHTSLNHVADRAPDTDAGGMALPGFILPLLPHGGGSTPQSRMLRWGSGLFTLAVLVALCCSAWNNRQLLHRVSFDIAQYHRIAAKDHASRARAVATLNDSAAWLNDGGRNGVPLRYGLGLYRGELLRPAVLTAIRSYVPPQPLKPEPALPEVKHIATGPQTVRLDSLSLFDTGQYRLRPDATRVLVNALVGIKAKPGWLIVVSGHTDNTGDDNANQALSLRRAEAVRDWMRDTGDVPESCFAVQGYGESRPVTTSDTPMGRALNRRVDIRLVPQADACRLPGVTPAPSPDDGVSKNVME